MEQLFLIEVVVDKIVFAKLPIPQKKSLVVHAKCGNFANMEIRTDVMGALETQERDSKRKDIDVMCGRSMLFTMNPKVLKETLKTSPLQLHLQTKLQNDPLGSVNINWNSDFIEMVESCEDSISYISPIYTKNFYDLKKKDTVIGNIEVFIRLSFLGKTVLTHIQIVEKQGGAYENTQFLFKDNNNATTFECKKWGMGSSADLMPIAKLFGTIDYDHEPEKDFMGMLNKSFMSVMGSASMTNSVFDDDMLKMFAPIFSQALSQSADDDTKSLTGKKNDLFTNIRDLFKEYSSMWSSMSMAMDPDSNKLDTQGTELFNYRSSVENRLSEQKNRDSVGESPEEIDYKTLTINDIESRLCKNPDCPAVKQFADYGIGPLAKGKGLGGMYKDVEAPTSYALSQINGRIDNYGPLHTYSRPKRPENDFMPKKEHSIMSNVNSLSSMLSTTTKDICKDTCPLVKPKLNGGMKIGPLRLRGGGPMEMEENKFPDPIHACQDLMDEFNKLLSNYKNALGPCGQATCPFAGHVVADTCRQICHPEPKADTCKVLPPYEHLGNAQNTGNDTISGCAIPDCPYKREIITPVDKEVKMKQHKAACGSPHCPFQREQCGLNDDLDIVYPPQTCSGKPCTMKDDLPPIHWDCPDALPVGDCKNPNCPFIKRDAIFKKYFPPPEAPCKSSACPYAVAPCTFPGCPFALPEPCPATCPYSQPVPKALTCVAPICPFAPREEECTNPNCPFAERDPDDDKCTTPNCPFARQDQDDDDKCTTPNCPFTEANSSDSCDDKCPFKDDSTDNSSNKCNTKSCPFNDGNNTGKHSFKKAGLKRFSGSGDGVQEKAFIKQARVPCKSEPKTLPDSSSNSESGKGQAQTKTLRKPSKKDDATVLNKDTSDKSGKQIKSEQKINSENKENKKITKTNKTGKKEHKKKKRRRAPKYVYDKGTYYPGNKIGHRECIIPKFNVPPDMGWLWNVHTTCLNMRPRRGWKPGAIGRTIAARIDEHRKKLGMKPISKSTHTDKKHKRKRTPGGTAIHDDSDSDISVALKPTLQVKKKDGIVYVTMNPLKDPKTLEDNEDPYMDCSPMQFKITKNKPPKDFKMCYCDENGEEIEEEELSNSSSSSELDIEFTPPAGIIHPERMKKKKNVCHTDTQYDPSDIPPAEKEHKKGKKDKDAKGKKGKSKGKKKA